MIRHEDMDNGRFHSRMHKTCACPYLCLPCNCLLYPCRKAVSRSKRRFRENGYDLDLAYVAPRIIVHGFPAVGIEHLYRNPRLEIRRFMDEYHKDHYKMFNFCCEPGRGYEPEVFYHRIERYPFKDHNTPPLATMVAFAESAKSWLDQDVANVVNMHCKAGKGRAGLMCCVLLVRTGIVQSAKEALDLYDQKRVTNNRGLTVTSQRKFVILYEALWRKHWGVTGDIGSIPGQSPDSTRFVIPEEPAIRVFGVELLGFPPGTVNNIRVRIYKGTNGLPILLHDSRHSPRGVTAIDCDCVVQGNFKLIVEQTSGMSSSKIFEFLHNTLFVERNGEYMDFKVDQMDIKRRVAGRVGENLVLRFKLVAPREDAAGDTSRGYEMVKSDPEVDVVELGDGAAI